MYEDDNIKANKAEEQDEMDVQADEFVTEEEEQDFDSCCCDSDYDSCEGKSESKVKKYGLLIFVVVVFLGLFSGIMLRLDRLEDQTAVARQDAIASQAAVMESAKAMEAQFAEVKATFDNIESRLDVIAKANTGAVEAVEDMKTLYKSTDQLLRETLVARDQLIREIISNLRLP
ncbi:MAG: hypothetical protein U9Q00_10700 [Synergistota bacterium]|nr:hypothetical protein [Synergistota bacterium]